MANAYSEDLAVALHRGIELCRKEEWDQGLLFLGQITRADERPTGLPGLFYSYLGYGIARCQRRIEEGRKLCEHAIKVEFYQPENYLNLARTCLLAHDRRAAVRAVRKGLKIDPGSVELRALERELGRRGAPVLPFLSRSNFLNQILGRVRHVFRRPAPRPVEK